MWEYFQIVLIVAFGILFFIAMTNESIRGIKKFCIRWRERIKEVFK